MIDLLVPKITQASTEQDRINPATQALGQKMTDNMVHFDNDLVIGLTIIADALCRGDLLQREPLIEVLRVFHDQRKLKWTGEYSPLGLFADCLEVMRDFPLPPDGKSSATWLKEVIEGGLSKKATPESTD